MQVNVHEAKTQLSRLLARAQAGEEVVIAKGGVPAARLVAVGAAPDRELGFVDATIPDLFWQPLPEDEIAQWE